MGYTDDRDWGDAEDIAYERRLERERMEGNAILYYVQTEERSLWPVRGYLDRNANTFTYLRSDNTEAVYMLEKVKHPATSEVSWLVWGNKLIGFVERDVI